MNWDEYRVVTKVFKELGYEMVPLNWDDPIAMYPGCKDHDMVRDISVEATISKVKEDLIDSGKHKAIKYLVEKIEN